MSSRISRVLGRSTAAIGLAAVLIAATSGLAEAGPAVVAAPATTVSAAAGHQQRTADFLTFTRNSTGGNSTDTAHPNATFGCSVGYPQVTTNFQTNEVQWIASISCSISLGLYGTTVLYVWPSGPNDAYGNQINATSSAASSSGTDYDVANGSYGLNFNIILTPPAGYTTSVSGGCAYINSTQIKCTTTTPFTMQSTIG